MFGSDLLEVLIGIVFIYILVSIICSAVREVVEAWLQTRSAYLEHGIRELLHDVSGTGLAGSLYRHPLIYGLYMAEYDPQPRPHGRLHRVRWLLKKGQGLPSYIPSRNFAVALMDMAARGPSTDAFSSSAGSTQITLDNIRRNVASLRSPAGLTMFSNTTNGPPFEDPLGVRQLFRYLKGDLSSAASDPATTKVLLQIQQREWLLLFDYNYKKAFA